MNEERKIELLEALRDYLCDDVHIDLRDTWQGAYKAALSGLEDGDVCKKVLESAGYDASCDDENGCYEDLPPQTQKFMEDFFDFLISSEGENFCKDLWRQKKEENKLMREEK